MDVGLLVLISLFSLSIILLTAILLLLRRYRLKEGIEKEEESKTPRGYRVPIRIEPEASLENDERSIKDLILRRVEAIKNKDRAFLLSVLDEERYSKFDDWPPFRLQGSDAIERETEAYAVLKDYDYELSDWGINILNDVALVTFIIRYKGAIRDQKFSIQSRVTALMKREENGWKLIHEHWSRFPEKA